MARLLVLPAWEVLNKLLRYEADTGRLSWRISVGSAKAGAEIMAEQVRISGKSYIKSRVIWKLVEREEPPLMVDHWDGNIANNRWDNLRSADAHKNQYNASYPNSRAPHRGVRVVTRDRGPAYQAYISVDGVQKNIGVFRRLRDAISAREKAEEELHGKFAFAERPI